MEIKNLDEVWTADDHRLGLANKLFHRLEPPNPREKEYAAYLDVQNFDFGDDYYIPTDAIEGYNAATGRVDLKVNFATVLTETWTRMPDAVVNGRVRIEDLPSRQ